MYQSKFYNVTLLFKPTPVNYLVIGTADKLDEWLAEVTTMGINGETLDGTISKIGCNVFDMGTTNREPMLAEFSNTNFIKVL